MLLIAIGSLLIYSCSKSNNPAQSITHAQKNTPLMRGGEDDDLPIIIIKHINASYVPQSGSSITLTSGNDTLWGQTDVNGSCTIHLQHLGLWDMHAIHDGYIPINATLDIVDSISTRIDTLQQ